MFFKMYEIIYWRCRVHFRKLARWKEIFKRECDSQKTIFRPTYTTERKPKYWKIIRLIAWWVIVTSGACYWTRSHNSQSSVIRAVSYIGPSAYRYATNWDFSWWNNATWKGDTQGGALDQVLVALRRSKMRVEFVCKKIEYPVISQAVPFILVWHVESFQLSGQAFRSRVRKRTLFSNNTNSTIRMYWSRAFILVDTPLGFVSKKMNSFQ